VTVVDPVSGTNRDVLTVKGTNLGENDVAALFLTDEKRDFKVAIVTETATAIRVEIRRTDHRAYRDEFDRRLDVVDNLAKRLNQN
jgi:hypothetical protein